MTNDDETAGRLLALETLCRVTLTGQLADARAAGASIREAVGYLDCVRRNEKCAVDVAGLNPRAAYAAIETADRVVTDVSESMKEVL